MVISDLSDAPTRDGPFLAEGTEIVTTDQATGEDFARYAISDQAEAVVAATRVAALQWWALGFAERAKRLAAWRREIAIHGEEAATLISTENGKSLEDSRVEVLGMLTHIQYAIDNAERVLGRRDVPIAIASNNQRAWIEYQPYGVVAVISPWNYPLSTPGAIVVNALAAGNAIILKPSHITPGAGEWLARTFQRAVPDQPDVLQAIFGYAAAGQALIAAGVDKVSFTGSVRSGRAVAAQCAKRLTPMLLELGGKDCAIIAEDADLDDAAHHVVWGALQNSGCGCVSVEVAYVVNSIHDAFVEKLIAAAGKVRAGSDDQALIGPVPLPSQIPIIRSHVEDALDRGATMILGSYEGIDNSRYVQPIFLDNVPRDALAHTEETFGPTLAIVRVEDTEEAVSLINGSAYGLGSSVFSRGRGQQIARQIRAGMTSINDAITYSQNPGLPFGGRGDSGYGRKHGEEGLREFSFAHSFSEKIAGTKMSTSTFGRPAGAMGAALAAIRQQILASG